MPRCLALLCSVLLVGCSVAPSPSSPIASASPGVSSSADAPPVPSSAGSPTASRQPLPASASLPVRRSAREIGLQVLMAPGLDGSLFILIPRNGGSVLASLDRDGRPRPGWPVVVDGSVSCGLLSPVEDGSVRVVCTMESPDENMSLPVSAFAFSANGIQPPGWPVNLGMHGVDGYMAGRASGAFLFLFVRGPFDTVIGEGQPAVPGWMASIGPDGTIGFGAQVPLTECCYGWAVGPDNVAYRIVHKDAATPAGASELTAITNAGAPDGFPVAIDGIASGPAFEPDGWPIVVTIASADRTTTRVLAFGRGLSGELPIATAVSGVELDCGTPIQAPLVSKDGTIFVYSWHDVSIFGLDSSLDLLDGWPFEPATPLERPFPLRDEEGINCLSLAVPAVGPDDALYLPLQARNEAVGGSVVAVGPAGQVRPGWPVELQRAGSEFWSVVVGSDGTAYALAIEPEAGVSSSASILAFAPDSTVLYTTTIVDP